MNLRNTFGTLVGLAALAALTGAACAAPVEQDEEALPEVDGTLEARQYTVPTAEPTPSPKKPTCCMPSTACCKEWCTYRREECGGGTDCWKAKAACDKKCVDSHG